jgi:hypothetical protein
MSQATQNHIIPTGRSALRFSAAAIVAGLTVPAIAGHAAEPDAQLIAACEEALRCEAWRNRVNNAPPTGDPKIDDAETDSMNDAWNAAFERVTELRARTPAGFRAKVAAFRIAVLEHVVMGKVYTLEDHGLRHERLAVSLCDDVLAGRATI